MKVKLVRAESTDEGTFGMLFLPNGERYFTGELPWRDNQNGISCIPCGEYQVLNLYSYHFRRKVYHVQVPGRFNVEIHPANYMGATDKGYKCQLEGCIALGEKIGAMDGQKALLLSRPAITSFENFMNGQPFDLEVVNEFE